MLPKHVKESDKIKPEKWKAVFLLELVNNFGHVGLACREAKINPDTAYAHRKKDKEFKRLWKRAKRMVINNLEKAGIQRATVGVRKPVYQQGHLVGHVQEYSDSLVIPLLKAHKKKYRQAEKESTGDKVPLSIGPIIIKQDDGTKSKS